MAALPFRFTGDEALLNQTKDQSASGQSATVVATPTSASTRALTPAPRELTVRALTVGLAIGVVLAAGNVFTGLKASIIDGGALTAALLSFTFFATFKRLARVPFGPLENNIAQTAASSAAVMGFVHGLMGPMPALTLLGTATPAWAMWLWGLALALIGVAIGVFLRRKLIVEDALPFPTGTATAELINTVHANRGDAGRRTRFLVAAALAAGVLTWFRDGSLAWVPQAFYLPVTIAGLTGASLTLGIASSPLMAATGMFIGLRGAVSLLLGGIIAWGVIAPVAVRSGWTTDASYGTLSAWLVWPALGVMLAGTFVPVILNWRSIGRVLARTVRDARTSLGARAEQQAINSSRSRLSKETLFGAGAVILAAGVMSWTGWRAFDFSPYLTCVALLLSVVLSAICARAAGETDLAPVGSFGTLAQISFGQSGAAGSLLSGGVVAQNASEVAQTLWALKAGHGLKASVRSQVIAQLAGAIVGSVVVVPTYLLLIRAYPLGSERMPAVSAVSWKATAVALGGGLHHLPSHGLQAAVIAFAAGTVLCILARTRFERFVPSAMGMGIAMITPVSLSAAAVLGAGVMVLARRRNPDLAEGESNALAAGLLVGESILGVAVAIMAACSS